jgi:hypothetical protein
MTDPVEAPAGEPAKPQSVRVLWRQWAMNEAVMARGSVHPPSEDALFRLADRIFDWVME